MAESRCDIWLVAFRIGSSYLGVGLFVCIDSAPAVFGLKATASCLTLLVSFVGAWSVLPPGAQVLSGQRTYLDLDWHSR